MGSESELSRELIKEDEYTAKNNFVSRKLSSMSENRQAVSLNAAMLQVNLEYLASNSINLEVN